MARRPLTLVATTAVAGVLALLGTGIGATAAHPQQAWAPASTASIHPGVQTFTAGAQCTANFIFSDASNVYIGQAAHCASTGGSTATDGCSTGSLPLGTPVTISGASKPGTLVYSSWVQMQSDHEPAANTCAYNDLALVRINPADVGQVNPSVPHWGGPTGVNTTGLAAGDRIYSYGNSELRLGLTVLSPKLGLSLGDIGGGWSHTTTQITPGIPGDSGSPLLDSQGRAVGVLSTLGLLPLPGSNNFGDVNKELAYLHAHAAGLAAVQLDLGTQPFNPNQLPLGL